VALKLGSWSRESTKAVNDRTRGTHPEKPKRCFRNNTSRRERVLWSPDFLRDFGDADVCSSDAEIDALAEINALAPSAPLSSTTMSAAEKARRQEHQQRAVSSSSAPNPG
jgi:hypothetical protein